MPSGYGAFASSLINAFSILSSGFFACRASDYDCSHCHVFCDLHCRTRDISYSIRCDLLSFAKAYHSLSMFFLTVYLLFYRLAQFVSHRFDQLFNLLLYVLSGLTIIYLCAYIYLVFIKTNVAAFPKTF